MAHLAATKGDLKYFERLISVLQEDENARQEKRRTRRLSTILTTILKPPKQQTTIPDLQPDPSTLGFNEHGFTPIHAAAFHNHPEIIKILVNHLHASPNQPTNNHHLSLPLHLAIVQNSRGAVRELLKAGANPWLHDGDGMDAFEVARRCGRRRCMSLLNQFAKRCGEQCLGTIFGGSCIVTYHTITHSVDNLMRIKCTDCDMGSRDIVSQPHSKSQTDLRQPADSKKTITHVRKSIPYGPWDVECGGVLDEDLNQLSDSDIDFPSNHTGTTGSL